MQNQEANILAHLRAHQFVELDQILNNAQLDFEEGKSQKHNFIKIL